MSSFREIVVVAFPHPGHLFPAVELCNKLAAADAAARSTGYDVVTLLFPSSTPTPTLHRRVRVELYSLSDSINFSPPVFEDSVLSLVDKLCFATHRQPVPLCVVVDEMLSWLPDHFYKHNIPAATFFTSSAASAALEHAMGSVRTQPPGLPEEINVMALTSPSLRHVGPPPTVGRGPIWRGGEPGRILASSERAAAILFNMCLDLERPFVDYLAKEAGKPVWGVGPLVRSGSPAGAGREAIDWLDAKPRRSVVYVAFGSLVSPSVAELEELGAGLEESNRPFIWVVQTGSCSDDVAARVVEPWGLVVRGWAPQVAILDHPSTGGYVCHCGGNSTLEALGRGVPMLTWPVLGDQFSNAKLVTDLLKVGIPLKKAADVEVTRGDVAGGIERLMGDVDVRRRVESVKSVFGSDGFPDSSSESLDRFVEFVSRQRIKYRNC